MYRYSCSRYLTMYLTVTRVVYELSRLVSRVACDVHTVAHTTLADTRFTGHCTVKRTSPALQLNTFVNVAILPIYGQPCVAVSSGICVLCNSVHICACRCTSTCALSLTRAQLYHYQRKRLNVDCNQSTSREQSNSGKLARCERKRGESFDV